MREKGIIKKFLGPRGFGFITRPGMTDLFFHISNVEDSNIYESESLEGVSVSFVVEERPDGRKQAIQIRS